MSGAIVYTVRCKECPECRQVTLHKGDPIPPGIIEAMREHVAQEHPSVSSQEAPKA